MAQPSRPGDAGLAGGSTTAAAMSQQNLNQIVIEYLSKKGYNRTEAMLRTESTAQDPDGRPVAKRAEDEGGHAWLRAMGLFETWIDGVLDIYKPELRRLLWPIFVYSYLEMLERFFGSDAKLYMQRHKAKFEMEYRDDLRKLESLTIPEHVRDADITKLYRGYKYRVTLSKAAFFQLVNFLESKETEGGSVLLSILNERMTLRAIDRASEDTKSLASMLSKSKAQEQFPAEDEGIPGHNPGSGNVDAAPGSQTLTRLKLGPLPMEPELLEDVMDHLQQEDEKGPPKVGQNTLVQELNQMIKKEDTDDAPNREDLPLPASKARDVLMEVLKVKEHRDRFKLEPSTETIVAPVSVCMFTFHNAYDSINCIDMADNNAMVAVGTSESYIRVWSVDGKPMPSNVVGEQPVASRRLIGHSGPVYQISFSPAVDNPAIKQQADHYDGKQPPTSPHYLISCSADGSVRLWDLSVWQCVVVYKGHMGPVWDVQWGPFGYYFLTGGHDKQTHLYNTENIAPLRTFVAHDAGIDVVAFHPNGCYVFSASSDKTVRMWAVANAFCVRMFTGHTGYITAMKCSPNGKLLATADDQGLILLWDLAPGKLLKRMRGHDKGGVWGVAWSAESTVLVSGGEDGTVRVWDVLKKLDALGQGKIIGEGGAGTKVDAGAGSTAGQGGAGGAGGGRKKAKGVVITSDQVGVFPTKKSPVKYIKCTRMNLVVAAGVYQP